MFRPTTAPLSHEDVLDSEASDWTFGNSSYQYIRGSSLRLIPLTGAVLPVDLGWPKLTWGQEDELVSLPGDIDSRWLVTFDNQPITSPQTFEFEPVSKFLNIDTEAGEYQTLRQYASGGSGKTYWSDNVNNARGWTVQTRVQVIEDPTGEPKLAGHYLELDDGSHRERIYFHMTGLSFEQNPGLDIYADLRSRPREIRIGARQDDLYVLLDDGMGVAGVDGFTGESSAKNLIFGTTGAGAHYQTLWDYFHQYHGGMVIDSTPEVDRTYVTTATYAYSPAYAPKRSVQNWVVAYFETSGDLTGGSTTITVQYKSSSAIEWVDFSTDTVDRIGWFQVLLDNVPTQEDGTDQIRFKIGQVSSTGQAEPPRIETITVLADFVDGSLRVLPHWGHRAGGNTVMLEQTDAAREMMLGNAPDTGLALDAYATPQAVGSRTTWSGTTEAWDDSFVEWAPWGYAMEGWTPVPASGGLVLAARGMGILTGVGIDVVTGQYIRTTTTSAGMKFSGYTGSGLDFYLEILTGHLTVAHGSASHTFYHDDYWTPKQVSLSLTGTNDLTFLAGEAGSAWTFGGFANYYRTASTATIGVAPSETGLGLAVSVFATPEEFSLTGGALLSTPGWELGLAPGGFPYARITSGASSDRVTGEWPVRCHERRNLAMNFRRWPDHTGLQVLVDGEVCGDKITTVNGVGGGTVVANGEVVSTLEQIRVYQASIDARDFSRDQGFSEPIFQVETAVPPAADNTLILRFWESGGAIADDSGKDHHAYAALKGRLHIYRDRRLFDEYATAFWGPKAIYKVLHTNDFTQTLPQFIYVEGHFYQPQTDAVLYKKMNAAETVGIKVELLTTGQVRVTATDGSSSIVNTGTYTLADGYRRALGVLVTSSAVTIWIDETEDSQAGSLGSLAAATEPAQIGPGLWAHLRQFALRRATITQAEFDTWRDWTDSKWDPTDQVLVGGTAIDQDLVNHFSPWRKYVTMPAGDPGYTNVSVRANGQDLVSVRPYKYVYGYTRLIPPERINKSVASTHSPFKIMGNAPDGSINLAYISGPSISVLRNVSQIDLSYKEAENLTLYSMGEFLVTGALTGSGLYRFTGQIDTSDLLITNRSAGYRDLNEPSPLYHRYLIGRRRYYVYQPDALTTDDALLVRQSIKLLDGVGKPIQLEDFPWDIEVSTRDFFGTTLPPNVFLVTLLTKLPYIPSNTIQVEYQAADSANNWRVVQNFREIVNTQSIYDNVGRTGDLAAEEYGTYPNVDGTYDLSIGITGAL
jgi:hypothetical protein